MTNAPDDPRILRGMAAQSSRLQRDVAAGARLIGWKVGFGAPAAMTKLGIAAPLVGYLLDRAIVRSGGAVSFAGWSKPVIEPELCVEMARDLPAGASAAEALAAIGAIGPALELADLDGPADDPEGILAGDIFQRHVVFGPRRRGRGAALDGLAGTVRLNSTAHAATTDLEANTGEVGAIVRHVADVVARGGRTLTAGEIIICGSVVPPLFVEPAHNAIEFELAPIGSVSVQIESDKAGRTS